MNFEGLFTVRISIKDDDKNFVLSTFLRSLYHGDSWFSMIKKSVFMNNYKYVAEKLYNHPNSIVFVACLNDDPSVILGYSIVSTELDTLHWVYVKKAWRNKGIAKNLVPPTIKTVTHLSRTGLSIYNKRKDLDFNPFKLG